MSFQPRQECAPGARRLAPAPGSRGPRHLQRQRLRRRDGEAERDLRLATSSSRLPRSRHGVRVAAASQVDRLSRTSSGRRARPGAGGAQSGMKRAGDIGIGAAQMAADNDRGPRGSMPPVQSLRPSAKIAGKLRGISRTPCPSLPADSGLETARAPGPRRRYQGRAASAPFFVRTAQLPRVQRAYAQTNRHLNRS